MRIGIFGGSFNPVHHGHVKIALQAVERFELDKLIVVPAFESPFKKGSSSVDVPWDRSEMVEDAFSSFDKIEIDYRELKRMGVSYAIDTVREISAENPGAELYFLTGEDCVADLPKWKSYDELVKLCTFVSLPRTKESSTEIRELFLSNDVVLNSDAKVVEAVKSGLRRKRGFCPCRLNTTPENFCPCDEFKAQIKDASFHGLCHCRLYFKP